MARVRLFLPLLLFVALLSLLVRGLQLDPRALPSALLDQPFPEFRLPALGETRTLQRESITGVPALLNVWASWCYSCRVEHPWLQQLAAAGVPIFGLNYKDREREALDWLGELGNPYRLNIADTEGSLGLNLGVYGAPETYLLDADGSIRHRHVGILDESVWRQQIEPLYRQLVVAAAGAD